MLPADPARPVKLDIACRRIRNRVDGDVARKRRDRTRPQVAAPWRPHRSAGRWRALRTGFCRRRRRFGGGNFALPLPPACGVGRGVSRLCRWRGLGSSAAQVCRSAASASSQPARGVGAIRTEVVDGTSRPSSSVAIQASRRAPSSLGSSVKSETKRAARIRLDRRNFGPVDPQRHGATPPRRCLRSLHRPRARRARHRNSGACAAGRVRQRRRDVAVRPLRRSGCCGSGFRSEPCCSRLGRRGLVLVCRRFSVTQACFGWRFRLRCAAARGAGGWEAVLVRRGLNARTTASRRRQAAAMTRQTTAPAATVAAAPPPSIRARSPVPMSFHAVMRATPAASLPGLFPPVLVLATETPISSRNATRFRIALPMTPLRSICVFCGSRPGVHPAYAEDARALGRLIAQEGWRLVYGAGDVGLMGETARAAQQAGAQHARRDPDAPDGAREGQARPDDLDRHRGHARTKEGHVHELGRDRGAARGARARWTSSSRF